MECFWIPWSPHDHYTPASLYLTFPLVTRVHLRRPSDFRLTFANTVAVIHNKASWLIFRDFKMQSLLRRPEVYI